MTIERIDHAAVLESQNPHRQTTMAVNLRVGQALVLTIATGVIVIEMAAKHGQGGRLRVKAPKSVAITTPEGS